MIILSNFLLFRVLVLPDNINCDIINRDHIKQLLQFFCYLISRTAMEGRTLGEGGVVFGCHLDVPLGTDHNRHRELSNLKLKTITLNIKVSNKTKTLKIMFYGLNYAMKRPITRSTWLSNSYKMHFKIICFSWIKTYSEKTHNETNVTCQI